MTKKQFFLSLCTVIVVILSLVAACWILKVKDSDIKYENFYENKNEIDVLFFGSSIVHYGIYPMEIWDDYGITSYNMGNNSERLYMTYYTMKNSFDYASPKVAVVDLSGLGWAGQKIDNTLKDHGFLDSLPLSKNKIEAVYDLFDKGNRLEFIFTPTVYHSRWSELTAADLKKEKSYTYGADILTNVVSYEKPTADRYEESRYEYLELETDNLLKMKSLCDEKGITLIFIFMPYEVRGGDQKIREFAQSFALENNILYYDFQDEKEVDWETDFADESHMNYIGAEKMSSVIGALLKSEFNVTSHKEDDKYSNWNDAYEAYSEYYNRLIP